MTLFNTKSKPKQISLYENNDKHYNKNTTDKKFTKLI